jgi:hypothetical protein
MSNASSGAQNACILLDCCLIFTRRSRILAVLAEAVLERRRECEGEREMVKTLVIKAGRSG